MNRRELLRALGTAALLPPLSGLSPGRLVATGRGMHRRARSRDLQVLDPHQSETVATIAELIIPATDTPGARAAQVDRFIDLLLAEWATDDDRAVGSGITGGWAAKELCERGLKTLVLEAGRPIGPARDYVEHVAPWEMKFRGFGDRKALERDQFIQRHCYACNEYSGKFFVNDRENPYTFDADKPFHWIRGRQVGGKSIMWGRQVYRWSDLDFEANARDGFGVDWPIRYADIAPWYDYVEEFIGISGEALGLPQLPDGKFLTPIALNCAEQVVRDGVAKRFAPERVVTIGRVAILTAPHRGRAACHYCGPCEPILDSRGRA